MVIFFLFPPLNLLTKKKKTCLFVSMPVNFRLINFKVSYFWVEGIRTDPFCITTLIPENDVIGSKLGVTILIKLNCLL